MGAAITISSAVFSSSISASESPRCPLFGSALGGGQGEGPEAASRQMRHRFGREVARDQRREHGNAASVLTAATGPLQRTSPQRVAGPCYLTRLTRVNRLPPGPSSLNEPNAADLTVMSSPTASGRLRFLEISSQTWPLSR